MEIGKITLSEKELHEAVQSWLESKGLKVAVACIQRGFRGKDWEITSVAEHDPIPAVKESYRPTACLADGCTALSTNDDEPNYCDNHKRYCLQKECLIRIPRNRSYCDDHNVQPADAPAELPKECPF